MLSTGLLVLVSSLLVYLLQVTSYRLPLREQEGQARIVSRDLFLMFFGLLFQASKIQLWNQLGGDLVPNGLKK